MKITSAETKQFAGLRNTSHRFGDGLNVVIGKNEDGKSTVINLIRSLLFQNSAINDRTDKDFKALYYPAKRQNGEKGDYIDGKLCFSVDGEDFTLYKKWGKPPYDICMLETPDGIISEHERVAEILRDKLKYGKGIFDEVICSSQKNQDRILRSLFDTKPSEMKSDLSSIVSKAMLETGGISVEKLKSEIQSRIADLSFRWDESLNRPDGGRDIDQPWSISAKNDGILKAYYEMRKLQRSEQDILAYEEAEIRAAEAKNAFNRFAEIYPALEKHSGLAKQISDLTNVLKTRSHLMQMWPMAIQELNRAEALKKELEIADAHEVYGKVCEIRSRIDELSRGLVYVNLEDIRMAQMLENNALALRNRLIGMNLLADIQMSNGHTATVVSAVDGKPIDITKGIHEAVVITVPDVMRLSLSPADIEVEKTNGELERIQNALNVIAGKYGVNTLEELAGKLTAYNEAVREINNLEASEHVQLNGRSFDDVIVTVTANAAVRSKDAILQDITELCKDTPLDQFIGNQKGFIEYFEKTYISLQEVDASISETERDLSALLQEQQKLEALPPEYADITDPRAEYARLQKIAETADAYARVMNTHAGISSDELKEEIAEKRAVWDSKVQVLKHWRHIQSVINEVLDMSAKNPYYEIERRFKQNLEMLAGHISVSEFSDTLTPSIYSKGNEMSADILSEGTKDTIALALRLAVIDYLYPNGGGLCILDDPFTDMDNERCERACALVKDFATRHQVIFFTCNNKYSGMLTSV